MSRNALWSLATFGVGLFIAASCGGRSDTIGLNGDPGTDASGGGSATGGNGQGAAATSTTPASSTQMSVTATSTTSTMVSTATGPSGCDFSGDCGICTQCAFEGPCQALWQICFNSQACVEFADCFEDCQGQAGCFLTCAQNNQQGAQEWLDAVQCMLCEQCESDCAFQTPPQLCN